MLSSLIVISDSFTVLQASMFDWILLNTFNKSTTWLDTGTHRSLLQAAQFVSVIEARQGRRICCPEVIALQRGWIDKKQLEFLAKPLIKSGYGKYLMKHINL